MNQTTAALVGYFEEIVYQFTQCECLFLSGIELSSKLTVLLLQCRLMTGWLKRVLYQAQQRRTR
jgi:hypothetical protein